jgi:hypothetical protein
MCVNGSVTLCIEKELLDVIDIDTINSDFASRNVRRTKLSRYIHCSNRNIVSVHLEESLVGKKK